MIIFSQNNEVHVREGEGQIIPGKHVPHKLNSRLILSRLYRIQKKFFGDIFGIYENILWFTNRISTQSDQLGEICISFNLHLLNSHEHSEVSGLAFTSWFLRFTIVLAADYGKTSKHLASLQAAHTAHGGVKDYAILKR